MIETNLFLDDYREPIHTFGYTHNNIYKDNSWYIVRNYDQFVDYIEKNGVPKVVSFDHDLADSHYAPESLWDDYEKSKEWQDEQVHYEKTGYECAQWLVDYCKTNDKPLPTYYCHSMNPVGKDKIISLLDNALKPIK